MIEKKYKEILEIATEGNVSLSPNMKKLSKVMFLIGFAESFYNLIDILKSDESGEIKAEKVQTISKEIKDCLLSDFISVD